VTNVGTRRKTSVPARPTGVPKASGLYAIAKPLGSSAAEARIREITERSRAQGTDGSVEYHERLGAIVVAHLYDGNVGAWRRRRNDLSLRKLARQLADVLHHSSLYRALSIFDLLERNTEVPGIRSLGVRALLTIARAPAKAQRSLLKKATAERWTGARAEKAVRQLPRKTMRGRRRKPVLLRDLTKMAAVVGALEHRALAKLDTETLRKCLDLAASIADDCDSLHKAVADALRVKEKPRVSKRPTR
jgi:hypothetical protein